MDVYSGNKESVHGSASNSWLMKLSETCVCIASKSDINEVLQVAVDGACAITGGKSGTVELFDSPAFRSENGDLNDGPVQSTGQGRQQKDNTPEPSLEMPLELGRESIGTIRISGKESGDEFSPEDEQALRNFAPYATLAISTAVRHWSDRRSKAELEALVDATPVGVLVFDAESDSLMAANRESQRMLRGLGPPNSSLDQILDDVRIRRSDGQEFTFAELSLTRALKRGERVRSEKVVIQGQNGESLTILVNVSPIKLDDGEVVSVVVTIQDAERQEGTERLRSDLLGLVSNELRTPLTTIKGSAATALGSTSPLDPAEMRQFFRIIDQQASHLRNLIRNLHDLARIEDGALSISREACSIDDIIRQVKRVSLGMGEPGPTEIRVAPGLPPILADKLRVLQILNSLLSYARKSSSRSFPIKVDVWQEVSYVAVSVEYESLGLSATDLGALLEKSLESGEDRATNLYDLELAVCKGIVEAHGGRIWRGSNPPTGVSYITFTMPVAEESLNIQKQEESAAEGSRTLPGSEDGQPPRILVVDDDLQNLAYTREVLSEAGYFAIGTDDPKEVYRLLETEVPELILLNLELPGVEGNELVERIPKELDVPVIFLSERGRESDVERAFDKGGDDYIVKPFLAAELSARVKAALRKREMYGLIKPAEIFQLGEVTINYAERNVAVAGRPVQLTATEYKLLFEFSISGGRILTHDQLLRRVWGMAYAGDTRLLRAFVKSLRRKLGDDAGSPSYIFTEPGVGYRLARA